MSGKGKGKPQGNPKKAAVVREISQEEKEADQKRLKWLAKKKGKGQENKVGAMRRKKKVTKQQTGGEDKKIRQACQRMGAQQLKDITEVTMFNLGESKVLNFSGPGLQSCEAVIQANTFIISGKPKEEPLDQYMPELIGSLKSMMGGENFEKLAGQASAAAGAGAGAGADDDEVPDLVGDFEGGDDDVPDLVS